MQTKLVDGVKPLAIDDEILALIAEETNPWGPGVGFDVFGVRNADGVIYRRIKCEGVTETAGIHTGLQRLGLTNEMTADDAPRERCSGIFSQARGHG